MSTHQPQISSTPAGPDSALLTFQAVEPGGKAPAGPCLMDIFLSDDTSGGSVSTSASVSVSAAPPAPWPDAGTQTYSNGQLCGQDGAEHEAAGELRLGEFLFRPGRVS